MAGKNKTSDAQIRASRNWEKKNPKKARAMRYKSSGKTFLRHHATEEELQEYEQLIAERRKLLAEEE